MDLIKRQQTLDTYNHSARELAEYFRGIGPRVKYIKWAISKYRGVPDQIVEIGCGDGRDAAEIVKRCQRYVGFDISEELIKLAKEHMPDVQFLVADAVTFAYPAGTAIVFAFASLLHLDREEVKCVFERVHACLKKGGVFYISLKWAPQYKEYLKEDRFGKRMFYLYNANIIANLAGSGFEVIDSWTETIGTTKWFEIGLRKC